MTLRTLLLTTAIGLALGLTACGDKDPVDDTGDGGGALEVCVYAATHGDCPECYSGEVTCSYGAVSVTEGSCGTCQAEWALYNELCELGVTESMEEIQAAMVCDVVEEDLASCDLAEQYSACDDCYSGMTTCTYEGYSATEGSCEECQARGVLYAQLCEDLVEGSREEIEAGTDCETAVE